MSTISASRIREWSHELRLAAITFQTRVTRTRLWPLLQDSISSRKVIEINLVDEVLRLSGVVFQCGHPVLFAPIEWISESKSSESHIVDGQNLSGVTKMLLIGHFVYRDLELCS